MMKTIYFIRHAKSSWSDMDLSDHDRPLNKRGLRDAPFMGKKLKELAIQPDFVISSTANRAFTTAKMICKELSYPSGQIEHTERIYEASLHNILYLITEFEDSHDTIFLFGHNPTMTNLSNYYRPKMFIPNVPTCGIVRVDFATDSWKKTTQENGETVAFIYPKMF